MTVSIISAAFSVVPRPVCGDLHALSVAVCTETHLAANGNETGIYSKRRQQFRSSELNSGKSSKLN